MRQVALKSCRRHPLHDTIAISAMAACCGVLTTGRSGASAAVIASGPSAPAASAASSSSSTNTYNYTTQGTVDYAYYGYGSTTFDHSNSVATSLFSSPSVVGSVNLGEGTDAQSRVTTTNGVSNTGTSENVTSSQVFTYGNPSGTQVAGEGIRFNYTLPLPTSIVNVYAVDFSGSGSPSETFSVTDDSTSTVIYTNTSTLPTSPLSDANHGYGLYSVTLTGTPGNVVTFQIVDNTTAGNVGFQGATATPEPGAAGLLALGGLGLLARRRRITRVG